MLRTLGPPWDAGLTLVTDLPSRLPRCSVLAFAWALSVVCLGLSAYIIKAGTAWPQELRNVMIENVFAWSWNVSLPGPPSGASLAYHRCPGHLSKGRPRARCA